MGKYDNNGSGNPPSPPPSNRPLHLRPVGANERPDYPTYRPLYDPRKFRIPAHGEKDSGQTYGFKASARYAGIIAQIIWSREFPELSSPGYFHRAALHYFIEYLQSLKSSDKVATAMAQVEAINQMIEEEQRLLDMIATIEQISKIVTRYMDLGLTATAARIAFEARDKVRSIPKREREVKGYLLKELNARFGSLYQSAKAKGITAGDGSGNGAAGKSILTTTEAADEDAERLTEELSRMGWGYGEGQSSVPAVESDVVSDDANDSDEDVPEAAATSTGEWIG